MAIVVLRYVNVAHVIVHPSGSEVILNIHFFEECARN